MRPAIRLMLAMCSVLALTGCTKTSPISAPPNMPPETTLLLRGAPMTDGGRQVLLQWGGSDEDGTIECYYVQLDSLEWHRVTRTESTFVFSALASATKASDALSRIGMEERHSFAVAAVDDRGQKDPTPAAVWFTPRNELPETAIVRGPAAITGPMVFFEWAGMDRDGVVVAYDYRLLKNENDVWYQVVPDPAAGESVTVGSDTVTVMFGPLEGLHKFEVWATDDEGGADPTPAEQQFTSIPELAGPKLYVKSDAFGVHSFRGPAWPSSYDSPVDIFPEQLSFQWVATAEDYGGQIVGYRCAYDDTSSWPEWSLEQRSFGVTPEPGEHSLYIHALDNAGVVTRARFYVNAIEADFSQYIVLVDDYDHYESHPSWASDADRDAFYDTLLCGYERPVLEWVPEEHLDGGIPQPPDVATLASASTVIWYSDTDPEALDRVFDWEGRTYAALAGYMRSGGNLILCGYKCLGSLLNESYPIEVTAGDSTMAEVFVRDRLRVGYADESGSAVNKDAPWSYGLCFYGALPTATGVPDGARSEFEPMYIDSLGKWWLIYGNPMPDYSHAGLPNVEALQPYGGVDTHVIDAFLNYNFEGQTCIVLSPTGSERGNVCYVGFPLYFLKTPEVKAFLDQLLPMFGETPVVPAGIDE